MATPAKSPRTSGLSLMARTLQALVAWTLHSQVAKRALLICKVSIPLPRGRNAGYAWLEEDGRCPYNGRVWREAGSDLHLEQMLVGRSSCMQWSTVWTGETLDSRVWHNGGLFAPRSFTPGECQDLCLQSVGCVGFNWFPNMNCTLMTKLEPEQVKVKGAVSGHPSCKGKGKD